MSYERLKSYAVPFLGTVLAAIGTFSELSNTPVGAALAFTGILAILTLWNSRGTEGRSIRMRAFVIGLCISIVTAIFYAYMTEPENAKDFTAWSENVFGGAMISGTLILVLSGFYAWFAYKHRAKEPRSRFSSLLSFFGSLAAVCSWIGIAVMNVLFAMLMITTMATALLSPEMLGMIQSLGSAAESSTSRVNVTDGKVIVNLPDFPMPYTWLCDDTSTFNVGLKEFEANDMDSVMMDRICKGALSP